MHLLSTYYCHNFKLFLIILKALDYQEFHLFAVACIDAHQNMEADKRKKIIEKIQKANTVCSLVLLLYVQ